MIKLAIFDLDDTLCDYQLAKKDAMAELDIILKGFNIDVLKFWDSYSTIEPQLFRLFLDGIITKDQYRTRRYSDILEIPDREEVSFKLNKVYMENANKKIKLFSDVIPCLMSLRQIGIKPVILTNGPSDGQRDKCNVLALDNYVEKVFIGEEIGCAKPNPKSFEYVLSQLSIDASMAIMVGDSIEDDMKGAASVRIKPVLIDRQKKYPSYHGEKISNLSELISIVSR